MYKQKLTLDPKLAEICEATLTVCDAEPLQQETLEKAANFKVLGCAKLPEKGECMLSLYLLSKSSHSQHNIAFSGNPI